MAIGLELEPTTLVLTKGRDFKWTFENLDEDGEPEDYPPGDLFFVIDTSPDTQWDFIIIGSTATIKIESTAVDLIPARTTWQLVFLPDGEAAGGDPVARGTVVIQK